MKIVLFLLKEFILVSANAVFRSNPEQIALTDSSSAGNIDSSVNCSTIDCRTQILIKRGVDLKNRDFKTVWGNDAYDADFYSFVTRSSFYVDKSLLVEEMFEVTRKDILIVTAPRGWGKSINLSMLKFFCDIQVDQSTGNEIPEDQMANRAYFIEGRILQNGEKVDRRPLISNKKKLIDKHLGKHPVIRLDGANLDMKTGIESFRTMIHKAYLNHEYLWRKFSRLARDESVAPIVRRSAEMDLNEMEFFYVMENIRLETGPNLLRSIDILTRLLWEWYGKKRVVILYDDYDSYVQKRYFSSDNTAHPENEELFRRFLSDFMVTTFKTNKYLEKGIITGILKVDEGTVLSAFNCAETCYIFDYHGLFPFYGVLDYELNDILVKRQVEEQFGYLAKIWYNGYRASCHLNARMYSTHSAIGFINELVIKNYRKESSFPKFLDALLEQDDFLQDFIPFVEETSSIRVRYETFRKLTPSQCEVLQQLEFGDVKYDSYRHEDIVFSALVMHGFGTAKGLICANQRVVTIQMSNREIFDHIREKLTNKTLEQLRATMPNFKEAAEDASNAIREYLESGGDENLLRPIAKVISDYLLNKTRNKRFAEINRSRTRANNNTNTERQKILVSNLTDAKVHEILKNRPLLLSLQLISGKGSAPVGGEEIIQCILRLLLVNSLTSKRLYGFDNLYRIISQLDVGVEAYGRQEVDFYVYNADHALFIELMYADNHKNNTIADAFRQCLAYTALYHKYRYSYKTVSHMAIHVHDNGAVEVWSTTKTKKQIEELGDNLLRKISIDITNSMKNDSYPQHT